MCRILSLIKEASEICKPSLSERVFMDYTLAHLDKGGVIQVDEITLKLSSYFREPNDFYFNEENIIIGGFDYNSRLIMFLSQLICLLCLNMNIVELTFMWDFIKYLNRLEYYKEGN